jgi:hypothetical protein
MNTLFASIPITLAVLAACHHDHHAPAQPAQPAAVSTAPLTEAALAVPIAPGRTDAWKAALEDLLGPRYAEYDSSRKRYGLTSQTTFLQRTPMGDFAVIHMTGADVRASFHAMQTSQDPWDVKWRQMTSDLHGFDFKSGKKIEPDVEPAFSMDDGAAGGTQFMFLAPLGDVDAFRAMSRDLAGAGHADYARARAALGIHREVVFLEVTPRGAAAVYYWRADDPQRALDALAADPSLPIGPYAPIIRANTLIAQYPH